MHAHIIPFHMVGFFPGPILSSFLHNDLKEDEQSQMTAVAEIDNSEHCPVLYTDEECMVYSLHEKALLYYSEYSLIRHRFIHQTL